MLWNSGWLQMLWGLEWISTWWYQWLFFCFVPCGLGKAPHLLPPSHGSRPSSLRTGRLFSLLVQHRLPVRYHRPAESYCSQTLVSHFLFLGLPFHYSTSLSLHQSPPKKATHPNYFFTIVPDVLHLYVKHISGAVT